MIYSKVETILKEQYPACPRPYFVGTIGSLHTFTFGLVNYAKALNKYYNYGVYTDSSLHSVLADSEEELAYLIYIKAKVLALDKDKNFDKLTTEIAEMR